MTSPASSLADLPLNDAQLLAWLRQGIDEHTIMAVTDLRGVILHVNERFCEISGYAREELVGQTHRLVRSDVHSPEFFADLWRKIASGRVWRGTICNRAKDGSHYWLDSTILPLMGPDQRPRYYLALRTDVSPLKAAEIALRDEHDELQQKVRLLESTQHQLSMFFEHAPIGISWREFDREGKVGLNHVNRRFCQIIGLSEAEAADINNVRRITHPDDWRVQEQLTSEVYTGKRDQFTLEKRYLRHDGKTVWGSLTVVVLRDENRKVTHHFAMLEDITERHQVQDELRRAEARWRTYLQTASEILYALTPEGRFKFVSPALTSKLGHATESVIGQHYADFVHPHDAEAWHQFFEQTLSGGASTGSIEYRMRHASGNWIWHASTGSAYSDRDGRRAFFGVGRDISIRREAQDQLKAALARREELERIINRSPSVVVLWRAAENWPVEFVSQSVRQFGYEPEYFTATNRGFITITHPDDQARVAAEVAAHAAAGHNEYNQEYRIVCADGRVRWVDDHTVVRRDGSGQVTHHEGLITDITGRKASEDREREVRERDLRTAGEIQQHLRPRVFPDISAVEIEALSDPSMLIGGDYYDVLPVDDRRWGFVIADVAGKGAGAALLMAECRATLRLCATGETSPAAVLRRANRTLQPDMRPGLFIALFYGIYDLDTKVLRYCRAGHEPPLLMRAQGEAEALPGVGLAVGLDEGPLFDEMLEEHEVRLHPGDLLALYTDGITEAINPQGEEFSRDRLASALQRHVDKPLAEVVRTVDRYVRNFCVLAPRHDDRTLLLVRPR
jgi:phosphoserine phosphatase RsbU/P